MAHGLQVRKHNVLKFGYLIEGIFAHKEVAERAEHWEY